MSICSSVERGVAVVNLITPVGGVVLSLLSVQAAQGLITPQQFGGEVAPALQSLPSPGAIPSCEEGFMDHPYDHLAEEMKVDATLREEEEKAEVARREEYARLEAIGRAATWETPQAEEQRGKWHTSPNRLNTGL